jgi:hypothetical protein
MQRGVTPPTSFGEFSLLAGQLGMPIRSVRSRSDEDAAGKPRSYAEELGEERHPPAASTLKIRTWARPGPAAVMSSATPSPSTSSAPLAPLP